MIAPLFLPLFYFILSTYATHLPKGENPLSGTGHILVLNSSDPATGTPNLTGGCLDNDGRFTDDVKEGIEKCGTFTVLDEYPYTISSLYGNCTFTDSTTVPNTDSKYGRDSYAWTCNSTYVTQVGDALYTIPGFKYTFLCHGDMNCYYDAKRIPSRGEKLPLWEYRWGYGQIGITPGHVKLQLMWMEIGSELPAAADDQAQEVMEL